MLDPGPEGLIIPFFRTPDDRRVEKDECADAPDAPDWGSGFCAAIVIVPCWVLVELVLADVRKQPPFDRLIPCVNI